MKPESITLMFFFIILALVPFFFFFVSEWALKNNFPELMFFINAQPLIPAARAAASPGRLVN